MLDYSKEKESMGEQVDPFDLTKKQEADLQRIRQFRLIDDVFMNKVFEDKSCVELLLQIILDRTDLHVENVNLQHGISNLQGRAVRLDILAVDDSGKIYNIEVQKNDHGAQAKRARYNSSLLDANITEAGNQYENLKETYVIFITENDVMQAGHPIYHIDRIVKETGKNFNDEAHIIYYEKRKQLRLEKEKPVLEAFWSWLDQQKPVRNTRLDKAVNYVLNRRDIAETYLEDGRCSFTNNLSENAIRPFAVGRKNWLFSSSVDGANASAVVYTMVEMAKAHGLNIYGYLKFLLENRPSKNMTDEQLAELAPWSEKLQSIKNRM